MQAKKNKALSLVFEVYRVISFPLQGAASYRAKDPILPRLDRESWQGFDPLACFMAGT
jgi:hypothetical protein